MVGSHWTLGLVQHGGGGPLPLAGGGDVQPVGVGQSQRGGQVDGHRAEFEFGRRRGERGRRRAGGREKAAAGPVPQRQQSTGRTRRRPRERPASRRSSTVGAREPPAFPPQARPGKPAVLTVGAGCNGCIGSKVAAATQWFGQKAAAPIAEHFPLLFPFSCPMLKRIAPPAPLARGQDACASGCGRRRSASS